MDGFYIRNFPRPMVCFIHHNKRYGVMSNTYCFLYGSAERYNVKLYIIPKEL